MTSLPIYDRTGAKVGDYEIQPSDLAARINKQLLHDAVVMYQANQRQGSHKSKTRAEVAGSTKKMYRQKGTGHARAGSKRSGIRRGGGHIHAKSPRDYSYRMPRKSLRAATRMALAAKIRDGNIVVIDELNFSEPNTKEMSAILKALNLCSSGALVTTESLDVNVHKSARNIQKISVSPVAELNAYTVLAPRKLLVTKAALDAIRERHGAATTAS